MSRNHEALARAVEKFDGRKFDYTPRNQFEEKYANYPGQRRRADAQRGVAVGALRSLRHAHGLASRGAQGGDPGQRGLLQLPAAAAARPDRLDARVRQPGAPVPDGGRRRGPRAVLQQRRDDRRPPKEVYDLANRNNTAIYALDPRGLAPFEFDINEGVGDIRVDAASLRMTQDTLPHPRRRDRRPRHRQPERSRQGAAADRQRLERVLPDRLQLLAGAAGRQVPRDQGQGEAVRRAGASPQGLLGAHGRGDGPCARARGAGAAEGVRDGARLHHAPTGSAGVIDPHLDRHRRAGRTARRASRSSGSPRRPPPGVRREEAARVSVTAIAPDGSAYFRGRVPDVPVASAAPQQARRRGRRSARARTRRRWCSRRRRARCSCVTRLRTRTRGVIDTDVREIAVPDLTAPQVQLSTPHVLRARTVKEFREISADAHAVPSASREFRRTDRLVIRFDAYAPAGTPRSAPSCSTAPGRRWSTSR